MSDRIERIDPKLLKPDPNQPRRHFDDEYILKIAETFDTHHMITPIEIDENNIIIRGEQRWRASLLKGLSEVPTIRKRLLNPKERLERQLVDYSKDLTPMEKAWAFATAICNINEPSPSHFYTISEVIQMDRAQLINLLIEKGGDHYHDEARRTGTAELSRIIGINQKTIWNYLQLVKLTPNIQKKVESKELSYLKAIEGATDLKIPPTSSPMFLLSRTLSPSGNRIIRKLESGEMPLPEEEGVVEEQRYYEEGKEPERWLVQKPSEEINIGEKVRELLSESESEIPKIETGRERRREIKPSSSPSFGESREPQPERIIINPTNITRYLPNFIQFKVVRYCRKTRSQCCLDGEVNKNCFHGEDK